MGNSARIQNSIEFGCRPDDEIGAATSSSEGFPVAKTSTEETNGTDEGAHTQNSATTNIANTSNQ